MAHHNHIVIESHWTTNARKKWHTDGKKSLERKLSPQPNTPWIQKPRANCPKLFLNSISVEEGRHMIEIITK